MIENEDPVELVRRRVFACMETGNQSEARTLLIEFNEYDPAEARALQADVVASYGIHL